MQKPLPITIIFVLFIGFSLALNKNNTNKDEYRRHHRCKHNEVYRRCSTCEGTCFNPQPICPRICFPPKCQCRDGYVRNSRGKCVDFRRCHRSSNGCQAQLCQMGTRCEVDCLGRPRCVPMNPCMGFQCPPGQFCTLTTMPCLCGPCPPVPQCRYMASKKTTKSG